MIAPAPMVRFEGFHKSFGTIHAVRDIDMEVARGETLALLGPNGGGKTTLLRALAGLHSPSSGRILIDGVDVSLERDRAREILAYLPQRTVFPGLLTAREVLELFARLKRVNPIQVNELLGLFALDQDADRYLKEYSGGMLQRLGLAVTFLKRVPLYILDEPTLNLDALGTKKLLEHLEALRDGGATVLVSSHSLHTAVRVADRVAVLAEGRIVKLEDVAAFRRGVAEETRVRVVLSDTTDAILEAVQETGAEITHRNGRQLHFRAPPQRRLEVVRAIESAGGSVEEFHTEAPDWDSLIQPHFGGGRKEEA